MDVLAKVTTGMTAEKTVDRDLRDEQLVISWLILPQVYATPMMVLHMEMGLRLRDRLASTGGLR